jgi:hypothetical protein
MKDDGEAKETFDQKLVSPDPSAEIENLSKEVDTSVIDGPEFRTVALLLGSPASPYDING